MDLTQEEINQQNLNQFIDSVSGVVKYDEREAKDLPCVSIVTPTYNRRDYFYNAIENFHSQTYPKEKLEWVIIDDGEDYIEDLIPKDDKRINYIKLKEKIILGHKRNMLVKNAKHKYIVHMDDDDIHFPNSVENRIRFLLANKQYNCIGSQDMVMYFIKLYQFRYLSCPAIHQIHEGTMAYTKKYWRLAGFKRDKACGEGADFLFNNEKQTGHFPCGKVMVMLAHCQNTFNKDIFLKLPNIDKKLLKFKGNIMERMEKVRENEIKIMVRIEREKIEKDEEKKCDSEYEKIEKDECGVNEDIKENENKKEEKKIGLVKKKKKKKKRENKLLYKIMNTVFKILIIFGICGILFFSLPNGAWVCTPRGSTNGIFTTENMKILTPNIIITIVFGVIIPSLLLFSKDVKENFKKKEEKEMKEKEKRKKRNERKR